MNDIDNITQKVAQKFNCFGEGTPVKFGNPLSILWRYEPPVFAAGVKVGEVVEFVIQEWLCS
jgi:hypothetical protein